jgi:antitoxin (DNA-binding transcriptional repressor) of toxin-antitoxin stability system
MSLLSLLWTPTGRRLVPAPAAFDRTVSRHRPGALEHLCEFNPFSPIYFIPTRPFLRSLARTIRETGARTVLEVAAGDGHLSRELRKVAPGLRIAATDSGAWEKPAARMTAAERRRHRNAPGLPLGRGVQRVDALTAIRRLRPDLVLACWLPPGPLLSRIARAVPLLLEIGADGYTGHAPAWPHRVCDDLQQLARCRLDDRPRRKLHSRITLSMGPG